MEENKKHISSVPLVWATHNGDQTHSTYEKILYTGNRSHQCASCCVRTDWEMCMALPDCIDDDGGVRFIFRKSIIKSIE